MMFFIFIYIIGAMVMATIIYEVSERKEIIIDTPWDYTKATVIIMLSWFAILAILIRGGTEW